MRFHFIDAEKANYPINLMCQCLSVSRSGYYAWSGRPPSARSHEDERLKIQIAASYAASKGRYGSPRIQRDLREDGAFVSRKRVARLMCDLVDRRTTKTPLSVNHGLSAPISDRSESPDARLRGGCTEYGLGHGHHVHRNPGRLALPRSDPRSVLASSCRLFDE